MRMHEAGARSPGRQAHIDGLVISCDLSSMHVTKDDFERLDPSAAVLRTSKLYSRADLRAPEGYPVLLRALEALIAAPPPTDFERIDKSGDEGAYRIGVRNGVPFQERVRG